MLKSQKGFTLIELVVVMVIIGTLAAIAIPSFISYRSRGFAAQTISDVRNAAVAEHAYFVGTNVYTDSVTDLIAAGFNKNARVSFTITTSASGFVLTATHANCGPASWVFDSLADVGPQGGPCN